MNPGHEIKCLDSGYVKLIDSMGSDEAVIEAARMSTGRGFVSWEPYKRCKRCDEVLTSLTRKCGGVRGGDVGEHAWQDFPQGDLGMLEFMYKNHHSSPFEFVELHIEVQAPIMVFREWHRHRVQSFSEFSARYSQMPNLHYVPEPSRIQRQSASNRQGSGDVFHEEYGVAVVEKLREEQEAVYENYDAMVCEGVAKEVARLNTPVSRYSRMRAKTDLRNWLAFLKLRMALAAQYEIRVFANAVAEIVKSIWPRSYALFEEHDLNGVHFSKSEMAVLKKATIDSNLLATMALEKMDDRQAKALLAKLGRSSK